MITWIQTNLQKHFRVVFLVLLTCVIIAFVFTIGATPGCVGKQKKFTQDFLGIDLNDPANQVKVFGDASTSIYLQAGYNLFNDSQLQQYALRRYALLYLANTLQIPQPGKEDVAEYIKSLPPFMNPSTRTFDIKLYDEFRERNSKNEGLINRVIADDIRVRAVEGLVAGPGYVMDSEVQKQVGYADTVWNISVVNAKYSEFNPEIPVDDEIIKKYIDENISTYEIPERIKVSIVEFNSSDYLNKVSIDDKQVRNFYEANRARFPAPEKEKKATEPELSLAASTGIDPEADFQAVRAKVEEELRKDLASKDAAKAASDASIAIYEAKITSEAVNDFLAARNLKPRSLSPFAEGQGPVEYNGDSGISAEAFKLNKQFYFSDAIRTPSGYGFLILEERQEARPPLFDEVKERATKDYKETQKKKLFAEAGEAFKQDIEAHMKNGQSFEDAVNSAKTHFLGAGVDVKTEAGFTLRRPPESITMGVFGILTTLQKGRISDMISDMTGNGVLVYAKDKTEPDLTASAEQVAAMRQQLAQMFAGQSLNDYLSDMINKGLESANFDKQ